MTKDNKTLEELNAKNTAELVRAWDILADIDLSVDEVLIPATILKRLRDCLRDNGRLSDKLF